MGVKAGHARSEVEGKYGQQRTSGQQPHDGAAQDLPGLVGGHAARQQSGRGRFNLALQGAQIQHQVVGFLIALLGILFEEMRDDVAQALGGIRPELG